MVLPTWKVYGSCGVSAEAIKSKNSRMAYYDLFFSNRADDIKEAKKVCNDCMVKAQCLEYALSHPDEHGIWGGTTTRERGFIHKKLKNQILDLGARLQAQLQETAPRRGKNGPTANEEDDRTAS